MRHYVIHEDDGKTVYTHWPEDARWRLQVNAIRLLRSRKPRNRQKGLQYLVLANAVTGSYKDLVGLSEADWESGLLPHEIGRTPPRK